MPTPSLLTGALLSALALAAVLPSAARAAEAPMTLSMVRGGALGADAVADGSLVYLPTGRVLATWDYTSTAAPLRLGSSAPAEGVINGLARGGGYLYASWRGYDGSSGVATYSLADPKRPQLVSEAGYPANGEKFAAGVAVANGHLYLLDSDHGVFVSSLADPARPTFAATPLTGPLVQYTKVIARGSRIYASGRTFGGQTVLHVFNVANPLSPTLEGSTALDGLNTFSLFTDGAKFMGVGYQLGVFDLDASAQLVPRASVDMPPALAGVRIGGNAASFGFSGLDLWSVIGSSTLRPLGNLDVSTLGARRSVVSGSLLLVPTETDLVQAFRMPKLGRTRHLSTSWLPAGVAASDIAIYKGQPLMLQANYGFTINDPATLAPLTRFEADLPQSLQERDFEQMAVSGDTAYLTAWGYGLITVDLSTGTPRELGRTPLVFASVIDVQGDYAYVAKWTNGGLLASVDVSDPATPTPVWQIGLASQPYRLKVSGSHAYLAEGREFGSDDTGGLRVFDLANPAQPVQAAHLDDGCGSAFDVAVDAGVSLLYLACGDGMQVIDIANPVAPRVVGRYDAGQEDGYTRVAQHGSRAWFGNGAGLHELDVSDPTHPVRTRLTTIGHQGMNRLLPTDDGRLFALGGGAGVHVFRTPARASGKGRAVAAPAATQARTAKPAPTPPAGAARVPAR